MIWKFWSELERSRHFRASCAQALHSHQLANVLHFRFSSAVEVHLANASVPSKETPTETVVTRCLCPSPRGKCLSAR